MEKKKISSSVMDKIEKEDIAPKAKWTFLLKEYVFWGLAVLAFVVGSLAMSVIIFVMANSEWDVYRYLNGSAWKNVLIMLPLVWLVIMIIFTFVAYYNINHTKHGYRHGIYSTVLSTMALSIIFGFGLYYLGMSHIIDNSFGKYAPGYHSFLNKKEGMLNQPEKGLLSGEIMSIEEDGNFRVKDFNGQEWLVLGEELKEPHLEVVEKFSVVFIVGEKIDDKNFKACALRPWKVRGKGRNMKGFNRPEDKRIIQEKRREEFYHENREEKGSERRLLQLRSSECGSGQLPVINN